MKIPILILNTVLFCMSANASPRPAACYLPTQSNVSYQQLVSLPTFSPDEIIEYGDDSLQFGELWLPTGAGPTRTHSKAPLLIVIHGGCWLNQYDVQHTHAFSTALTQAGYAVWAIEYRRTGDPGGGWPGSLNDIRSAIAFVPELVKYPVNLSQTAIIGHSAGGHLALLAGSDQALTENLKPAIVIGLAPIVDLIQYAQGTNSCQLATSKFMGGTPAEIPKLYAAANPITQITHPNTVIIHGSEDPIVPLAQSIDSPIETDVIKGAGHFDLIHPGTPAFQALLKHLARAFDNDS